MDHNEANQAGVMPEDPTSKAVPVSEGAKQIDDEESRLHSVQGVMKASWDEVTAPKGDRKIITTCHYEIDRDTGGFCDEDVWVIAGRSQWGKTSYTIACADENIKRGHRVLIVSGEDRPSLYGSRLVVRRTGINRYRYANNRMTDEEFDRGANAVSQAEDCPVYLDARGKSVEWASKKVKQIVAAEGIDLIFWDYIQCFHKDKPMQDQRLSITYIARVMTDTIKTSGKAGALLSQVTPDDKALIPDMYSIRDSKDVANAAEVVAIGFVPTSPVERDVNGQRIVINKENDRCMVLAKNKPGPGPGGRVYRMVEDSREARDWSQNLGCFGVVREPQNERDRFFDDLAAPLTPPHWEQS